MIVSARRKGSNEAQGLKRWYDGTRGTRRLGRAEELVVAQRDHGIHTRSAPRGDHTRHQSHTYEQNDRCAERQRIERFDTEQEPFDQLRCCYAAGEAQERPDQNQLQAVTQEQVGNVPGFGAQRHAHSNFGCALPDCICHERVETNQRETQSDPSKRHQQQGLESACCSRCGHQIVHGAYIGHGHGGINLAYDFANPRREPPRL